MCKNCTNICRHSNPCKYIGWYSDQVIYCAKFGLKLPFDPPLKGGFGLAKSKVMFPKQCKYKMVQLNLFDT